MIDYNKTSVNFTVIAVICFISILIAINNSPDNIGFGGLAILIIQPIIAIFAMTVFFIFKKSTNLHNHPWIATILGCLYLLYNAFFGYWNY